MAADRVYRKIVRNKCKVEFLDENNNVKEVEIEILGDFNDSRLETQAKKRLGTNRLLLKEYERDIKWGGMSLEKFVKYCDYIDDRKVTKNG